MSLVSNVSLARELSRTIVQINMQIEEVKKTAEETDVMPYRLLDTEGSWVMAPLLCAKANALNALAIINNQR